MTSEVRILVLAVVAGLIGGCSSETEDVACTDCRSIAALESNAQCSVAVPGYHYVAAPLPYTGAWPVGAQVERGVRQAVLEINDAGGVHGKPLGLVLCRTASDPERASSIMRSLVEIPEINATTCCMRSAETIPASEIGRSGQLVMLSPGATSTEISLLDDDGWVGRTVPPDSVQGAIAARLAEEGGASRVFVATLDDPYGTALANVFTSELDPAIETMQRTYREIGEEYSPSLAEVTTEAVSYDPDLVFVAGLARDASALVNVAANQDFRVSWLLPDGARTQEFVDAVTDVSFLDGIRGTAPAPPVESFRSLYGEKWGESPQVFVAAAYDAIYLLAIAMELAEDADDRVAVRDALNARTQVGNTVSVMEVGWAGLVEEIEASGQVNYEGASGPVDLDGNGDVLSNVELWTIQSGEFESSGCRTPENEPCN